MANLQEEGGVFDIHEPDHTSLRIIQSFLDETLLFKQNAREVKSNELKEKYLSFYRHVTWSKAEMSDAIWEEKLGKLGIQTRKSPCQKIASSQSAITTGSDTIIRDKIYK